MPIKTAKNVILFRQKLISQILDGRWETCKFVKIWLVKEENKLRTSKILQTFCEYCQTFIDFWHKRINFLGVERKVFNKFALKK